MPNEARLQKDQDRYNEGTSRLEEEIKSFSTWISVAAAASVAAGSTRALDYAILHDKPIEYWPIYIFLACLLLGGLSRFAILVSSSNRIRVTRLPILMAEREESEVRESANMARSIRAWRQIAVVTQALAALAFGIGLICATFTIGRSISEHQPRQISNAGAPGNITDSEIEPAPTAVTPETDGTF